MSKIIKVQDMLLKRNPEKYEALQKRNKKDSKKKEGNKKLKSIIAELETENGKLASKIDLYVKSCESFEKEVESLEKENERLKGAVKELQDELKEG